MKKIEAEEAEEKKISLMRKIKNNFKYDIKKIEVIANRYDLDRKIILHQNAFLKAMIYYAVTIKTQGDIEIMGWLAGKRKGKQIEIIDAYIGDCNSSCAYTEMDPIETIKAKNKAKEKGLSLVGQWHSHPGMSTSPSGVDNDFMNTIERFGMKEPVQLIVNSSEFSLTMFKNGKRKKVEFIIPPKTDNNIDINLGYINGEYRGSVWGGGVWGDVDDITDPYETRAFYGYVGNRVFERIHKTLPFLKLNKYVDWS